MKDMLRSVAMAFSMFSSLPTPQVEWKDSNMKYMLCALPLVGAAAGVLMLGWYWLCAQLSIGKLLFGAGMVILPLAVSGGIHLDGFCDTSDALASHAPAEKKREILKDSRAGAFAVIGAAAYFVVHFALCAEIGISLIASAMLALHQVFARAIGALAGTVLPSSSSQGLLASFKNAAAKKAAAVLTVWCVLCACAMIALSPIGGTVCTVCGGAAFLYIKHMSRKQFGGMSGDLAGFIITVLQPALAACFIISERMASVWF
ncbi:MAG: adenosylcobinamide-GDP ribazoletransferase [Clostridia bacterium]|nr:adenosylcobinamide-GDP ribazoletransferase [Clostridia bacterium]